MPPRPGRRGAMVADAVVDAAGRGQFTTVQDAVNAAPYAAGASRRWVIFVRAGTYRERVYVPRERPCVSLIGEDPARTIITCHLDASLPGADGKPIGTFGTPTVTVDADDFVAENLTFENSAGPVGQALALRVDGDRGIYRNVRVLGWHDTLLLNRGRQYFEDSFIAGYLDFIFGAATAYFARCRIHALRDGFITAASTPRAARFGFVFAGCRITGEQPETATYLGRPWRDFGHVAFLRTEMTRAVHEAGWHNWDRPSREKTARCEEYASRGPGARAGARVKWARSLSKRAAAAYTVARVLGGRDRWNPLRVRTQSSRA